MNKKTILAIACLFCVGCSTQKYSTSETAQSEITAKTTGLPDNDIVSVNQGCSLMLRDYSLEESLEEADLVIIGTIEEIEMVAESGIPISDCTVRIDEVLKGNREAGEKICVSKMQGTVTKKELADSVTSESEREIMSPLPGHENDLETYLGQYDVQSETGVKSVYILTEASDGSPDEYWRFANSEYIEVEPDLYVQNGELAGYLNEAVSAHGLDDSGQTISWENPYHRIDFVELLK